MRKLLIGCGVALALGVALLIAGGIVATSWFKKQFPEASQVEQRRAELVQKYGRPESYVPPSAGVPLPERLASFVALRESLVTEREEAATRLGSFVRETQRNRPAGRGFMAKLVDAVGMTQGGASMVSGMLDYMGRRSRMQVQAGMGEGEYDYLYSLTTFASLQWDPLTAGGDSTARVARDLRKEIAAQKFELQSLFETQLGNLQKALEGQASRSADEESLLAALCTELPAAKQKNTFPFAGTLPPTIAAALAPYEGRLRAALPDTPMGALLDVLQVSEQEGGVRFRWGNEHGKKTGVRVE